MAITPVNGHLIIEPLKADQFVPTDKGQYEEIGIVVSTYDDLPVKVGDRVFFDSWLASKYPKNEREYFWLVKWDDVRAIEHVD